MGATEAEPVVWGLCSEEAGAEVTWFELGGGRHSHTCFVGKALTQDPEFIGSNLITRGSDRVTADIQTSERSQSF